MPSRAIPFSNGEYYHVFNRGVAKSPTFLSFSHYRRFLSTLLYYQIDGPKVRFSFFDPQKVIYNRTKKIIEIICYCLMPNHFHLLVKQVRDKGITECISKLSNSYTKYFNTRDNRVGSLFQGEFKAVHIEDDEQLLHVSRYIHLNPLVGHKTKILGDHKWSSYSEYIGKSSTQICEKSIILKQFKKSQMYESFVLDQVDYARKIELMKHQLIDFGKNP